jgi:NAD(P)-dependent dehydrogenase (short-subunit alcohol dehydrogenase family)
VTDVVEQVRHTGGQADGLVADLASLSAAARLAREAAQRAPALDVLINNAGVGPASPAGRRELSHDGYELRLAVNYLAPWVLVRELLRSGLPRRAIVNVASAGQAPLNFDDPMLERSYDGWQAYSQSKVAIIMLTFDLAEAHPDLPVNALHPGTFLDTAMVRDMGIKPQGTAEEGAAAVVAVLERSLDGNVTGTYFDGTRPARPDAQALDATARRQLHRLTEALAGSTVTRSRTPR